MTRGVTIDTISGDACVYPRIGLIWDIVFHYNDIFQPWLLEAVR